MHGRKRGKTYSHSTLHDGDDIVRAVLVETRTALFVVENDDRDVDRAENAELISFFEEAVLSLERGEKDKNILEWVSDAPLERSRICSSRAVRESGSGVMPHGRRAEAVTNSDRLYFDFSSTHGWRKNEK